MIKEGKHIENEFNSEKPFTKWATVFEFDMIISEYSEIDDTNDFFEDLKKSFDQFIKSFSFISFNELNISCPLFSEPNVRPSIKQEGIESVYILFSKYNKSKLQVIFSDIDGWDIFAIFINMTFQNIEHKVEKNDNNSNLLFGVDNRSGKSQLFISFTWEFGAEWFYNEFKEENRKIIRDAILSFYESNPNYKRLRINYLLSGFDLELNKYTEKEVIVNENSRF